MKYYKHQENGIPVILCVYTCIYNIYTCTYIHLHTILTHRMPFKRSSSMKEALEKYQEDQEDTGVTGFITIPIDLKKIDARSEDPADLKKTLELIPKSKESKKVGLFVIQRDKGMMR